MLKAISANRLIRIALILIVALILFALVNYLRSPRLGKINFSGTITTVFIDCSSITTLKDGKVTKRNDVSCDGGSFIVLNGETLVQTSSGLTSEEYYFEKHDYSWEVGDVVSGTILSARYDNGTHYYSLNCSDCDLN